MRVSSNETPRFHRSRWRRSGGVAACRARAAGRAHAADRRASGRPRGPSGVPEDHPETKARLAGFQRGLEKRGWFEGRNVRIDYRFAPTRDQAQVLAKELVALQPDVILANSTPVAAALQRESRTIPIVFAGIADPIGSGLITSLARPGGNMTGLMLFEASVTGKWLAMLKEIAPGLVRAGFLTTPSSAAFLDYYMRAAKAVGPSLGIEPVIIFVQNATDIERAIDTFASVPNSGLVVIPDAAAVVHSDLIIALTAHHRIPAVYFLGSFVAAGGSSRPRRRSASPCHRACSWPPTR